MNRRDPLILVAEPELVSSGLWPDRHSSQTPLWEVADNAQFAGGKVRRRVPNALVPVGAVAAGPVTGIGQMQDSVGVRWVWFTKAGEVYRWYGPAAEHIGTLPNFNENASSVQQPTLFDFTHWGNWMLVNSEDNGIWRYTPAAGIDPATFAALPNAPNDAVAYFKKRNQLIAVGYGLNKRLVGASDADDITNWDFTDTTALTVELPLEELNTPVRAACHFGPSIAVFGENQMFEVSWIGSPFYYGQNKLLDGIGAVGKFAVCSDGRIVYGVSRNGVWKTDGMQYSYSDEVVLRDYLQNNVNWEQAGKIVCAKNDITGCIEFSFPIGNSLSNNEGWAYDPRYGGWSKVPAFSAMDNRVLLQAPLQGQANGNLELMFGDATAQGDLLLETKALLAQRDNSALHIGALMDEVELFIHQTSGVEFQYGVAEFPDGPFSWTNPIEVKKDQITYKLDLPLTGTYHKLRLKNFDQNWSLDLQGFAIFGEVDGQKRDKL